jgi:hypothetical protein
MKFLSRLWQRFTGTSRPLVSAERGNTVVDELLARFLTSRSHFAPARRRVKLPAFLPGPDGTLSVFAIQGLDDRATWLIGDRVVAEPAGRTIHARAEFESGVVPPPLTVVPDDTPPRHRTIDGWPPDDSARHALALELANAARLVLRRLSGGAAPAAPAI